MKRFLIIIIYICYAFVVCTKVWGQGNSATLSASAVTGNIVTCQGMPSVSPAIEEFSVSGNYLTSGPVVTAPAGFEVSLSLNSNYGNSVVLPAVATSTGGQLDNQVVYVRASAAATAATTTANIIITATGATTIMVSVTEVVNALATVNSVSNQTIVNGGSTTAVNFTGTGSGFSWTNDTPAIGLAASGSGNISSFIATNTGNSPVTATITVTPQPASFAYINNVNDNTVSVINTSTNKVIALIPVGTRPSGVAISTDGNFVYISNYGSNNISVISTSTNKVVSTISNNAIPGGVCISPDGKTIYVSNIQQSSVSVINVNSGIVTAVVPVGVNPDGICISPDGSTVYVQNSGTSNVSVINTATNTLITNIGVGIIPSAIAISNDGTRVYTANGSGGASVINTANNSLIATINSTNNFAAVCVSTDGSKIYIGDLGNNCVMVYNTTTYQLVATIPVDQYPAGVSLSHDGNTLYVTDGNSNAVSVVNTLNNTVIATIPVGNFPISFGQFVSPPIGCSGIPKTFTITVNPTSTSAITTSGIITATNTTYGTPSAPANFSVSGTGLGSGILVSPPTGFEVSTDGVTFSKTVILGSAGSITSATVYIRLAATSPVNTYMGNVVLSATNSANTNISIANSIVSPAVLNITANTIHKKYGGVLAGSIGLTAFTSTGLQNNETIGSVTMAYGGGSLATAPVGTYAGSVMASLPAGGSFSPNNYTISYTPGDIFVDPADLTVTADDKSKVLGADNPMLTVSYSGFVNGENASVLNPGPTINTTAVTTSPVGNYPITVSGAGAQNYTITYIAGILTINPVHIQLIIPNAFTPNGDGVNDTWQIQHIESYPNCTVFVYNRYGEKVLSSIGYGVPWDGTYKGSALPSGTYYYLIDTKSDAKMISGWVAIIR